MRALAPPVFFKDISRGDVSGLNDVKFPVTEQKHTAVIWLDGFTSGIGRFLENLNNHWGAHVNFIGGGGGRISFEQHPCVICNEGYFQDAAVCCILECASQLGVRHGWNILAGPLVATATEGNKIIQLNWRNAADVYRQYVERDTGDALNHDNFFETAIHYPFGILRQKEEYIVRNPVSMTDDGQIVTLGEVPTNTVLSIMKSHPEAFISAAADAQKETTRGMSPGQSYCETLVVDCISRPFLLEKRFSEELDAIRKGIQIQQSEQEPQGVLSMGEISSSGSGLLEFYNMTVVVGTLYTS